MLTQDQALSILGRYVPAEQAEPLLTETTITRTVGGVTLGLYDPYAAALAWSYAGDGVKSWQADDLREEYFDPSAQRGWLAEQSAVLRAGWPAADGAAATFDLGLNIVGWGQ